MFVILAVLMFSSFVLNAITEQNFDEPAAGPIKLLKPSRKAQITKKDDKPAQETSEKKAEKKGWLSFFSNKTINNMNFQELKEGKQKLLDAGDKSTAIKYLEKMMPLCNDLDELKIIMMELANIYFETDKFEKASKIFNEFTVLYPGCDEVEFALYQAILSNFKLTLDPEHDQTKTQEAKELALSFLGRESFTTYRKEVKDILSKCEERLFESDTSIFNCYMKIASFTGQYANAKKHLSIIKESYLDKDVTDIALKIAKLEADFTAATLPHDSAKTVVAKADVKERKDFKNRF